jgi:Uma2 family endonuclease
MGALAKKPATYDDLLKVPESKVAELINGALYEFARPRSMHANASSTLGGLLELPFRRGRGGPGGWILLDEPELHLGSDVLVPDLAGWRRSTMPELPDVPFHTLAPDWVCEVLSPSTAAIDRSEKMPIYAAHRVGHLWLVDPAIQTLEVLRLDGVSFRAIATHAWECTVRAEPFDAVELTLGDLWSR